MRHAFAIVLLCTPALLAAEKPCTKHHAARVEVAPVIDITPLLAWQRAILFEQQIL